MYVQTSVEYVYLDNFSFYTKKIDFALYHKYLKYLR